jgi:hypothetical protein
LDGELQFRYFQNRSDTFHILFFLHSLLKQKELQFQARPYNQKHKLLAELKVQIIDDQMDSIVYVSSTRWLYLKQFVRIRSMQVARGFFITACIAASLAMTACGGGGGGGTNPSLVDGVQVNGAVSYDSIPNTTGPLDYSAPVSKPVRGAQIELISSATQGVIASTVTDGNGNYSVAVPRNTVVFARVLASLLQNGSGATWETSVRDNTRGNAIYALESETFAATDATPVHKNFHASSGWGGQSYTSARSAAPFAILDVIYRAQAKVLSVAPDTRFAPLSLFWSMNNTPAFGDPTLGQIGSSQFMATGGVNAIYLLGKADVNTDEYDASVIGHEWGHYLQATFGRIDSAGGAHTFDDLEDPRVAFSEGWATAMSGIVLDRNTYCDSLGVAQSAGFSVDLSVGATGTKGWFRESSVQHVVWQLNQLVGFKPLFDALSGAMKTAVPLTTIFSFNASLKLASGTAASSFAPMLDTENIDPSADAWASSETNTGGSNVVLPLYRALPIGTNATTACVSNTFGAAQGDNKLGNYTFLRFVVSVARNYQIQVSGGAAATNPNFQVYGAAGAFATADLAASSTETLHLTLAPGEYVLVLTDYANSSSKSCFNVTVN